MLDTKHIQSPLLRATNWEIHPVTQFEFCTETVNRCSNGFGWHAFGDPADLPNVEFVDNREFIDNRQAEDSPTQRINKSAKEASESIKKDVGNLSVTRVPDPNSPLPSSFKELYESSAVAEVLTNTKAQLVQGLQGRQLQGLRSYVEREFPSAAQIIIYPVGRNQFVERQRAQELFAKAEAVIEAVDVSDSQIEINITSSPDDATFQLMSYEGQIIQNICTNGCPVWLFRGDYKYEIVRPGFKKKTFELLLMNRPPKLKLECRMVKESDANTPSPCKETPVSEILPR